MHLATCFRSRGLGRVGECPVAEGLFEQFVSLPIHPRLTDEAVSYLIESSTSDHFVILGVFVEHVYVKSQIACVTSSLVKVSVFLGEKAFGTVWRDV